MISECYTVYLQCDSPGHDSQLRNYADFKGEGKVDTWLKIHGSGWKIFDKNAYCPDCAKKCNL